MNANPIDAAIQAAGSGPKLGAMLGVTGRAVYKWRAAWEAGRVDAVPPNRAIQIEKAIGIHRHILRPDLWPPSTPYHPATTAPATPAEAA